MYRGNIIDAYAFYTGAVGNNFNLKEDNAWLCRACIEEKYFWQETVQCMEWPARSPNLNPIEHIWNVLRKCVVALNFPPQTLNALVSVLWIQWASVPMMLTDTIKSINVCIAAQGSRSSCWRRIFYFKLAPLIYYFYKYATLIGNKIIFWKLILVSSFSL